MSSVSDHAEIVAALLWDVPRLRAGSASARDFAAALPGEPKLWWKPRHYRDDPLGRAARAVALERANEPDEAAKLYDSLIAEQDAWDRLLGLMLSAWSGTDDRSRVIADARAAVDEIQPSAELTARLLAKLATYAFDEGESESGKDLLAEAIDYAPDGSLLRRALTVEGYNVGLRSELAHDEPTLAADPLVEYSWIKADSLQAAQASLAAAVEARSRRVWTYQWGGGRTPLDDAVAAEVQATWAGALWLRRPIRKQLGAQLLSGAAVAPAQWGYGVVMWTLGGGNHPERAYALAEPALDQSSTDFIVKTLGEIEPSPQHSHRFLSIAVEAWDALSDDVLRWVIEHVEPTEGDDPIARETQRLWAGYAARLEDEWIAQYEQQSLRTRSALLEMLGIGVAKHFSQRAREAVFETAKAAVAEHANLSIQLLRVLAVTAPRSLDDDLRRVVGEKASPSAIASLVYGGYHQLLTTDTIGRARTSLIEGITAETEDAKQGRVSFGPADVRLDLGHLVAGTQSEEPEAVELLMTTAVDPELPAEHLLQARNALTLIRRANKLSATHLHDLHTAPDPPGTFPEHGGVAPELLRVSRLQVLALDLTPDEVISVVGACRAQDPRVRQVALVTSAEATGAPDGRPDGEALAWALIGGLFDPNDEVVESVVSGLGGEFIQRYRAAGRVVIERLPRLVKEGSMSLRAAVGDLAGRWSEQGDLGDDPAVRAILAQVQNDRSWIVRTTARRH